ncbi:MAG: hypothetical protein AAF414_21665 [Pseudomonadota bacterium]
MAGRTASNKKIPSRAAAIASACLALSPMAPSAASGQEGCELPNILLRVGEIAFIDHGDDGVTPGDNRVLLHYLFDDDGEEIGTVHALSTVLHSPTAEGTTIYVEGTLHVDSGTVHWTNTQTLADPGDTSRSTADHVETVIAGGTGAFQHARGIMLVTPLDDNEYELSFDIVCDG